MYKMIGIILSVIGIIFLGSVYILDNNLNKSILDSLKKDQNIKRIESVNCHILMNKCNLFNISFNDSNATIGNVELDGLIDLIIIQMSEPSEMKTYDFKLSFNDVRNVLSNNEYTKLIKSSINDSMDYSFNLKFMKNKNDYNSSLSINIKQNQLIIDSFMTAILHIDKSNNLIAKDSYLNDFNLRIKDPQKKVLSMIYQSYLNEVNISGVSVVHNILGIEHKKEVIDEDTLEAAIILSLMEFYRENNIETLLVSNPSLSNITLLLNKEKNLDTLLLESNSILELIQSFKLFLD